MSDRDFQRVATRVHAMAGIVLEDHKRQMIVSRLSRRLRARDIPTISDYLDHLDKGRDAEELQEFVNTLTTNLTSMFREVHHYHHFEKNILGPLKLSASPRLRIWSAGCSSGEEPYSLALSTLETLGKIPQDVRILATDLDTRMLERGRRGQYAKDRVDGMDQRYRRHLKPVGDGSEVAMPPAACNMIAFRQLNLMEQWPMKGKFDAIFCRNVMIYFSSETKANLINRFARYLVPGGYLYLGHSESILGHHELLNSCGETIYQLRDGA